MREFIGKYGIIIIVVALLAGIVVFFMNRSKPSTGGSTALAFFVDENDLNYETIRPVTDYPPIVDNNGRTLVQAIKRSDDDGKTSYVALLMKYTPEFKQILKNDDPARLVERGNLQQTHTYVRSPKSGSPWLRADDPEAQALLNPPPDDTGKLPITIFPQ